MSSSGEEIVHPDILAKQRELEALKKEKKEEKRREKEERRKAEERRRAEEERQRKEEAERKRREEEEARQKVEKARKAEEAKKKKEYEEELRKAKAGKAKEVEGSAQAEERRSPEDDGDGDDESDEQVVKRPAKRAANQDCASCIKKRIECEWPEKRSNKMKSCVACAHAKTKCEVVPGPVKKRKTRVDSEDAEEVAVQPAKATRTKRAPPAAKANSESSAILESIANSLKTASFWLEQNAKSTHLLRLSLETVVERMDEMSAVQEEGMKKQKEVWVEIGREIRGIRKSTGIRRAISPPDEYFGNGAEEGEEQEGGEKDGEDNDETDAEMDGSQTMAD